MKGMISISACLLFVICACSTRHKRDTISLNGIWQITEGVMDKIPDRFDRSIQVPGLVSLAVPAFKNPGPRVSDRRDIFQEDTLREAFWYSRSFNIDRKIPDVVVIKVSKAMFGTKVYLNGHDLGEHLPCFTPGYFDASGAVRRGENQLIIRVGSCRNSIPPSIPDGFDFEKERYIPGIFDNVELILSGTPAILTAQAAPDISRKQVRVQVKVGKKGSTVAPGVNIYVREAVSGKLAGRAAGVADPVDDSGNESVLDVNIPIENCRFWSPEDPFLYDLEITTSGDKYETRFGMREFRYDTLTGMTMLNGQPYFMRGSNITLYRFFEDEACGDLPWNNEWVRKLHKSFKQFNWNGLRYCIGLAPEEWYRIADEEGILIQNEFPIWYGGKGWCVWPEELKSDELAREYTEWIQDEWNHPSIVIWDASNETLSDDGKTEEIAGAISRVRHLDISGRPWDNSYSFVRSPGDVLELHPYHFYNPDFKLKDIAVADINPGGPPGRTKYMKIVNEYGWLWLNRDGRPTTLTTRLYENLLGADSSIARRRHIYATYLAAETEFWRCHRQCAAVLHFTALAYSRSDGQTSDHFTDVANLTYETEFLKYIPDAFSPVALMLDEWGNEIRTGSLHKYNIIAINDLNMEWQGTIHLEILKDGLTVSDWESDFNIPAFGQSEISAVIASPLTPGVYLVVASLEKENHGKISSIREIPYI
jgi:beta-galactosidase